MRQQQRSAIAIVAAGLLGGTGVGVAAAHLAQPAQHEAASPSAPAPAAGATTTNLAARINQLITGTQQMNRRLIASRHDLRRQLRELSRLRERAAAPHETALSGASLVSPPAVAPAPPSPPPAPHTTTGASGAGGTGDDGDDHHEQEHADD